MSAVQPPHPSESPDVGERKEVDRKDEEQGPDLLAERAQRLKEMRLMEKRQQNSVVCS
jgi:hypothetical protein